MFIGDSSAKLRDDLKDLVDAGAPSQASWCLPHHVVASTIGVVTVSDIVNGTGLPRTSIDALLYGRELIQVRCCQSVQTDARAGVTVCR